MSDHPDRVSHYRIIDRIGRGATGDVYRAVDERLGRTVALKLLRASISDSADLQARLLREAQAASALNHPGIVTVHDIGGWKGRVFMVMELVDGERFSDLARAQVPVVEVLALVADAADALASAHARAILHRDIKSDNLMRTHDGRVKVLDFGLAKLLDGIVDHGSPDPKLASRESLDAFAATIGAHSDGAPGSRPSLASKLEDAAEPIENPSAPSQTVAGSLLGTPAYMSPEQASGQIADARSEVFSLGVVLYELLCGKRPFDRATIEETLEAVRSAPITPPSRVVPGRKLPPPVDELVMRALERDPSRRFVDMKAFATSARATLEPLVRGQRWVVPLVGVGVFAIAAVVGFALRKPPPPTVQAAVTSTRRLTFEPGCDEHPTFSPDGKTIVYDGLYEGDYELLSLDLATGATRRLVREPGWDWEPVLSRDGRWLAWAHAGPSGRDLEIMAYGGDEPALRLGPIVGQPAWAPNGSLLMTKNGSELERITPDGATARRETLGVLPAHAELRYLTVFDDGAIVGMWAQNGSELVLGAIGRDFTLHPLAKPMPLQPASIEVAPSQLAFYYTRFGGNAPELVRHARATNDELVVAGGISAVTFAFAPDGKRLVYSTCRESRSIARLHGAAMTALTRGGDRDQHPVAVDDHRVLFSSDRSGSSQVWLLDERTQTTKPLTPPHTSMPAVSADASSIAYSDTMAGGIFIVPLEGGAARRLTSSSTDRVPVFSFDAKHVYFEHDGSEGTRIWRVPTSGGEATPVTPIGGRAPATSTKDDRLVYLQRTSSQASTLMQIIGSAPPAPIAPSLPPSDIGAVRISPDGERVAFLRNETELLELPIDGSTAPSLRWRATVEGVESFAYASDGRDFLLSLDQWDGDLWSAEGDFR